MFATPLVLNCDVSAEIASNFYDVSFGKLYDVNSAPNTEAAANLYSLIASCKLHGLDPELYLAEVIRIMPYWPRDRFLELAPAYWAQTRTRLDPPKSSKLSWATSRVPPILANTAEQAAAS